MMSGTKENHPTPDESHKSLGLHCGGHDNAQRTAAIRATQKPASVVPDVGYLPDQPDASSSDLEMRLKEAEQSLKIEKERREKESILHGQAMNDLQAKLKDVEQHLEVERHRHQQTKFDLIEKHKDANHQRQLMLDAVGELNRFLRGSRVPNQSTDDEIIQKAMTLRVGIRDFAILHFEGNIDQVGINQDALDSLNKFLRIPQDYLKSYISTSPKRVNVIRAFLWAYLCEAVFNQFSWTWQSAGTAFHDICGFLDILIDEKENGDSQGKRKFHTWRANTASLLIEAMSLDEATSNSDCQQLIQQWSNDLSQLLGPFTLSRQQELRQGLEGIISQSVELDKEIYKQIANIEWLIHEGLPCTFVPNDMELEPGQEQNSNNGVVTLVLGPGLVKYGKSSGDRFDMMERLLKTQVFCEWSLGDVAEDAVLAESQERGSRIPGIKGKLQAYRRRIGNALAPE